MSVQTQSMPGLLPEQQSPASWLGTSPPRLKEPPRKSTADAVSAPVTQAVAQRCFDDEFYRLADGKPGTATACVEYRFDSPDQAKRELAIRATDKIAVIFDELFGQIWEETKAVFKSHAQLNTHVVETKAGKAFMFQFTPDMVPVSQKGKYAVVKGGKLIIAASESGIQKVWNKLEQLRRQSGVLEGRYADSRNRVRNLLEECYLPENTMYSWIAKKRDAIDDEGFFQKYYRPLANAIAVSLGSEFAKKEMVQEQIRADSSQEIPYEEIFPGAKNISQEDMEKLKAIGRQRADERMAKFVENLKKEFPEKTIITEPLKTEAVAKKHESVTKKSPEKAETKRGICGLFGRLGLKSSSKKG